jgi:hypothetical protein
VALRNLEVQRDLVNQPNGRRPCNHLLPARHCLESAAEVTQTMRLATMILTRTPAATTSLNAERKFPNEHAQAKSGNV